MDQAITGRKWGLIGLGYISDRHINAMRENGIELVVACDCDESKRAKVPSNVKFETDYKKLSEHNIDGVSICTPNYLHYEMCQFFKDKTVICEKPLVLHQDQLLKLPRENINVVLQLRYDKETQDFYKHVQDHLAAPSVNDVTSAVLDIKLNRGDWYFRSWKGDVSKSGGILYNIGIHYFDLVTWMFSAPGYQIDLERSSLLSLDNHRKSHGSIVIGNQNVFWDITLEAPMDNSFRRLMAYSRELFMKNFEYLHAKVYDEILQGRGIHPDDVSVVTTYQLLAKYDQETTQFIS